MEMYSITYNSKWCCWCIQPCRLSFPGASYTQKGTLRAQGWPLSWLSEAATVWAGTCNQQDQQGPRRCSWSGTGMMAGGSDSGCDSGPGSRSGCQFSVGVGRRPWPSTQLVAPGAFCDVLPSGRLTQLTAGCPGGQRLHPLGPAGGARLPPRV